MGTKTVSVDEEQVPRFCTYRIIEHAALMLIFFVLAGTGLPQKFYYAGVSRSIIILLGGIDNLRFIHHFAGCLFAALAVQHVFVNFAGIMFYGWQPSMLITVRDARDAFYNVKYDLGLDDKPVRISRYSYKEKAIYWLVLMGGCQMIITGFVLWFPVLATVYLPGILIPLSKTIHTSEAMLIFLLVVTWHIYDSALSPEVFPLNTSIFTGRAKDRQKKPDSLNNAMGDAQIISGVPQVDRKRPL